MRGENTFKTETKSTKLESRWQVLPTKTQWKVTWQLGSSVFRTKTKFGLCLSKTNKNWSKRRLIVWNWWDTWSEHRKMLFCGEKTLSNGPSFRAVFSKLTPKSALLALLPKFRINLLSLSKPKPFLLWDTIWSLSKDWPLWRQNRILIDKWKPWMPSNITPYLRESPKDMSPLFSKRPWGQCSNNGDNVLKLKLLARIFLCQSWSDFSIRRDYWRWRNGESILKECIFLDKCAKFSLKNTRSKWRFWPFMSGEKWLNF